MNVINRCDGALDVKFDVGLSGKTILVSGYSRFPLHYTPLVYLDEQIPEMATLYTQNMTDGICGGDHLNTSIEAANGTKLFITTISATKIHRTDKDQAKENINIKVGEYSYVEYQPGAIIPFSRSDYSQNLCIDICDSSTFISTEYIYPGRIHRGELFDYTHLNLIMDVQCNSELICSSSVNIKPAESKPSSRGIFGDNYYMSTLYGIAPWCNSEQLCEQLDIGINVLTDCTAAAGKLPYDSGVFVKMMSVSSIALHAAMKKLTNILRKNILGAELSRYS